MSIFQIRYSPRAEKDAEGLDETLSRQIQEAVATKLSVNPEHFGKPLRYSLKHRRSLRVGDWRVGFEIQGTEVRILAIWHRSKGYKGL